MTTVRIAGGALVIDDAEQVVADYLDPTYGYAWPSYDTLITNDSVELVTGDLLAPALLEAPVDAGRFRVLSAMLPDLAGVAALPAESLQRASDTTLEQVAALFAVLDTEVYRRRGVRGTVVSKVLHRKRPDLVPLYDSRIDAAYRASGRLAPDPHRPWAEFMQLLMHLMREDLQREASAFEALVGFAAERGATLTQLRLLDILIWMSLEEA